MNTSESVRLDQHRGYRHPFLVGTLYWRGIGDEPRTITEMAMGQLSAKIRRKSEWWKLFRNPNVRNNWAEDALRSSCKVHTSSAEVDVQLSREQVDYVLDELVGYATLHDEEHGWQVSCFERIWESDTLLDVDSISRLNKALTCLRKQTSGHKPSEDGVTTHLIDPFMHCLVYGRSLVSDPKGSETLRPASPPPSADIYTVSQRFAFLPSDISVSSSGSVCLLSYINDLEPRHNISLYRRMETTLSAFIPLFEHVLTDLHRNNPLPLRIKGTCRYTEWEEPEPPEYSDDEEGWGLYEREMRNWVLHRPIKFPDIPDGGYPGGLECRNHTVNLRERTLQVVVNVSDIRLQPGGPSEYPGTPWHVEGMKNERIVACGLYYTSVENITHNSVDFRMAVTWPRGYFAGDTGATLRTWGFDHGAPCCQLVGSVPTRPGLALTFPNIYQYRRTPFRLADPAKEGHQTVVAFFLVDPEIQPITSTSRVGSQQHEWTRRAVDEFARPRLPAELVEKIMRETDGLMTEEEAKEFRTEMQKERAEFWEHSDYYHFCAPFDVWDP